MSFIHIYIYIYLFWLILNNVRDGTLIHCLFYAATAGGGGAAAVACGCRIVISSCRTHKTIEIIGNVYNTIYVYFIQCVHSTRVGNIQYIMYINTPTTGNRIYNPFGI